MSKAKRTPDFRNLEAVLRCEAPSRPTLFEFFMNDPLYERLSGMTAPGYDDDLARARFLTRAFEAAGYDYVSLQGSKFGFPQNERHHGDTYSLNENATIFDRASFDAYNWLNYADFDYTPVQQAGKELPPGMKIMLWGPGGVLENVMGLTGYDNLCMMIYDDPQLVYDLFEKIGTGLEGYYAKSLDNPGVGLVMSNDDWGFNTQTMLSPEHMREFVFPWHKRLVDLAHSKGLPISLHSCGQFAEVIDDVIEMGYDAKHSYEDVILPVEEAYDRYKGRIAVLGGLDVDFMVNATPEEITARGKKMLEKGKTGYALGTGNSVPEYIPQEHYFAMTRAALEE